jgi:hypothetical protein
MKNLQVPGFFMPFTLTSERGVLLAHQSRRKALQSEFLKNRTEADRRVKNRQHNSQFSQMTKAELTQNQSNRGDRFNPGKIHHDRPVSKMHGATGGFFKKISDILINNPVKTHH